MSCLLMRVSLYRTNGHASLIHENIWVDKHPGLTSSDIIKTGLPSWDHKVVKPISLGISCDAETPHVFLSFLSSHAWWTALLSRLHRDPGISSVFHLEHHGPSPSCANNERSAEFWGAISCRFLQHSKREHEASPQRFYWHRQTSEEVSGNLIGPALCAQSCLKVSKVKYMIIVSTIILVITCNHYHYTSLLK